jgi:hypothetical protein
MVDLGSRVGAIALLLAFAVVLLKLDELRVDTLGVWIGVVGGVIGAAALTWRTIRASVRMFAWDSASGTLELLAHESDPMGIVARHFRWLLDTAARPVLFLIDDLDRCQHDFVVELLDTIQTLMRDAPEDSRRRMRGGAPQGDALDQTSHGQSIVFLVAADGRWLRRSYEVAHREFVDTVARPGQPLGYLFADKLFQLSVPVPALSPIRRRRFLASVLLTTSDEDALDDGSAVELSDVLQRVSLSSSEDEILQALQAATPEQRIEAAPQAMTKLIERPLVQNTEHELERYADLLPTNPRSVKRFVMDYGVLRAARTAEGGTVTRDHLALWTVIRARWPALADQLQLSPDLIALVGAEASALDDVPSELRSLFVDADGQVRAVLNFEGIRFTSGDVRDCAGLSDPTDIGGA